MRRLHATGRRERFVASGVYPAAGGLQEFWSVHEVGDGAHFIRVDRDGRGCRGHSLLQEALRNAGGAFERVDQQLYGPGGRPVARLRCTRFQDRVELEQEDEAGQRGTELSVGRDCLFLMPGILLAGMALSQATGMQQSVNVMRIAQVGDGFTWEQEILRARCGPTARLTAPAGVGDARACAWDGSDTQFWLDPHDVTLRLVDDGGGIELCRYARRHD
ncbi:MAG: hypothetical protein J4G17_11565 [Anaerolineae bacterium]|nr:hypothetical protein [Anaerolineae bacterium]